MKFTTVRSSAILEFQKTVASETSAEGNEAFHLFQYKNLYQSDNYYYKQLGFITHLQTEFPFYFRYHNYDFKVYCDRPMIVYSVLPPD